MTLRVFRFVVLLAFIVLNSASLNLAYANLDPQEYSSKQKNWPAYEYSKGWKSNTEKLTRNGKLKALYKVKTTRKALFLTMDAGYLNKYCYQILNTLKRNKVKVTFFVTEGVARKNSRFMKQLVKDGHAIGNHTATHPNLSKTSGTKLKKEVCDTEKTLKKKYKIDTKLFRFPYGSYSQRALARTTNLGYTSVFWDFAYLDYDIKRQPSKSFAYNKITSSFHKGEVLLLHPISKTNAQVLGSVIKRARKLGYTFETLEGYAVHK